MNKQLFLGIAEDNGISMAILGNGEGKILGRQLGRSFDYQRLGLEQARANLYSLVHSMHDFRGSLRLHTVSLAVPWRAAYQAEQLIGLVHSVVTTSFINLYSFPEAAMSGMPGKKPEILLLTDSKGSLLLRCDGRHISKPMKGGGAMDVVKNAVNYVEQNPTEHGVYELQECLTEWWIDPCKSRAGKVVQRIDSLADTGNLPALKIMGCAAHSMIQATSAAIGFLRKPNPLIGLCGSVALGCRSVQKKYCNIIRWLFPKSRIESAAHAPAKGAYLSSLAPQEEYHNVEKQVFSTV